MKKYIQSIVSFIFVFSMPFLLVEVTKAYKEPYNFLENPLVWVLILFFGLVVVFKEILAVTAIQKAEKLQMEKDGVVPEKVDPWAAIKAIIQRWTNSKPIEQEGEIALDHNYDGIRELDNSLPPWWKYMFYASIVFAVVYLIRFEVLDGDNQIVEYEKAVAQAQAEINKFKKSSPDIIDLENVTLLTEASDLSRGKAVFNLNCASCHMADGGGSIGPNLTDENWILGGGIKNVFATVSNGGRDGKGMVAWKKILKPIDVQKVASYVLSLQGTTPAKAKAPQGEVWKEEELK
ncbi:MULTISPECIES: cbb3-type cytochrome c oxidase N-terminal domain-containing protein [Tenacibaculum]|uniref:cbb3-type cytochrome c oxidase N-terminal domain-containing protein n=1 Tax=Tenacibaculum TaxID=104267 RepID=UPI001F0A9315|nr:MULTISPECIES: cbb3-type cytochrome c oxidase N-terminal domain-containing protein [Tenacibaculum]MCH3884480.1 c-type cytochrome [Tenacibaculum aquimarinum]MDO6600479.1 cbb3-type cytochrome c oxidase N-terminal domain-containing protein [Tenacibaculum sp. 1_MG-2023]